MSGNSANIKPLKKPSLKFSSQKVSQKMPHALYAQEALSQMLFVIPSWRSVSPPVPRTLRRAKSCGPTRSEFAEKFSEKMSDFIIYISTILDLICD
jgi:hypothetical protein